MPNKKVAKITSLSKSDTFISFTPIGSHYKPIGRPPLDCHDRHAPMKAHDLVSSFLTIWFMRLTFALNCPSSAGSARGMAPCGFT